MTFTMAVEQAQNKKGIIEFASNACWCCTSNLGGYSSLNELTNYMPNTPIEIEVNI